MSPELSWLPLPTGTATGWVALICSNVDFGTAVAGKEFAGVGNSSDLMVTVGFVRKANTAKVTIHANSNPRSVQTMNVWVIVSVVDASMGESSFNFRSCVKYRYILAALQFPGRYILVF
jgi:hypothetical protein